MVNVGLSFASLIGIALAVSGAALYFLRSFRPNLARDHDVFFAAVALGAGGILFFNGWRLDPILQFGQLMLGGSAIFFAVESIRLRGVATEQAKQRTPVVDDDRPVSRVYRAELDDLEQLGDREPRTRRIPASRDRYRDEYSDDYRRPERSESIGRLNPSSERIRRRRPRPETGARDEAFSAWGDEAASRRPRRNVPPASREGGRPLPGDRVPPRRSGPASRPPQDERDADYVDYRPANYPENQPEGSSDYPYPGV
ncbi:Ycf66 family protein [Almyronema epifaneia]|uniref:Ycf66 family protein n=1 Tax=Almyronema epifaneia S1 TaxID=2991925 RepID=A0ABW6IIL9_9CYAN